MPNGVVFQRGWPLLPPRFAILERVRCGEITPSEAEKAAAALGIGPLACKPNPVDFDPMQEASWSLLMGFQWLKWHSSGEVRDVWDKYRFEFWDWVPIGSEHPYPAHVGHALCQRGAATLALVDYPCEGPPRMTTEQAEEWLLRGAGVKAVRIFGTPSDGTEPQEIPSHHRVRLHPRDGKDGVALRFGNNSTRGYEAPYVLSVEVVSAQIGPALPKKMQNILDAIKAVTMAKGGDTAWLDLQPYKSHRTPLIEQQLRQCGCLKRAIKEDSLERTLRTFFTDHWPSVQPRFEAALRSEDTGKTG
jgi:hypothetical protein